MYLKRKTLIAVTVTDSKALFIKFDTFNSESNVILSLYKKLKSTRDLTTKYKSKKVQETYQGSTNVINNYKPLRTLKYYTSTLEHKWWAFSKLKLYKKTKAIISVFPEGT